MDTENLNKLVRVIQDIHAKAGQADQCLFRYADNGTLADLQEAIHHTNEMLRQGKDLLQEIVKLEEDCIREHPEEIKGR
jgi:hypothetical protein